MNIRVTTLQATSNKPNCYITNWGLLLADCPKKQKELTLVERGGKFGKRRIPDTILKCFRLKTTPSKVLLNVGINFLDHNDYNIINRVLDPIPDYDKYQSTLTRKPTQTQVLNDLLDKFSNGIVDGGAVLQLEAGRGKTYISGRLIEALAVKTLIVIPKGGIAEAWTEMLSRFPNITLGEYSTKIKKDGDVVIMNVASTYKDIYKFRIKRGVYKEISGKDYFAQFGLVIYDEVHNYTKEVRSNVFFKTCFRYRLGLSATPWRAKAFEPMLYWNIGPLMDVNHYFTDDIDWVGKVHVIKYHGGEEYTQPIYNGPTISFIGMVKQFEADPVRHNLILDKVEQLWNAGRNIIVFAERTEYCVKIIFDLVDRGVGTIPDEISKLIGGASKEQLRKANLSRIIVVTYGYGSEGISYNQLDALVLATPRKSNMQQIVHRVMRSGGDPSIERVFVDIVDQCTPNFKRQYGERKKTYKKYNFDTEEITICYAAY